MNRLQFEASHLIECEDFKGKNVAIGGSPYFYKNQSQMEKDLIKLGAKIVSVINEKTAYYIQCERPVPWKTRRAMFFKTPTLTEEEFIKKTREGWDLR